MSSKNPHTAAELVEAIKECSTYHSQLTKEAAMGKALHNELYILHLHKHGQPGHLNLYICLIVCMYPFVESVYLL